MASVPALVLFFCFIFAVGCNAGPLTADEHLITFMGDSIDEKIAKHHRIHSRQTTNASQCMEQLRANSPEFCNFTGVTQSLLEVLLSPDPSTDEELTALNNALRRLCVSACVGPIVDFFRCLPGMTDAQRNYDINRFERGTCGQEGGDFCDVRYLRRYRNNTLYVGLVLDSCNGNDTGIFCNSSTSTTCLNGLTDLSSNLGCCFEPYFGSGVNSCNGVSVAQPCTGVSSATGMAPVAAIVLILCAFLGLLFQ